MRRDGSLIPETSPSLRLRQRVHPAHIPREAPGDRRPHPQLSATPRSERRPTGGIPADSRSARERQARPVTPEVAGSSPVAPVKVLQIVYVFDISTAGFFSSRADPARESAGDRRPTPAVAVDSRRLDDR